MKVRMLVVSEPVVELGKPRNWSTGGRAATVQAINATVPRGRRRR